MAGEGKGPPMMRRVVAPLFIPILLLPAAIIGLACGGGDSAQPPTSEATPTAAPPSPTPTPTPTPTPEAEETLGHYENSELGFTFDYPAQWEQIREPISFEAGGPQPELDVMAMVAVAPVVQESEKDSALIIMVNANTLDPQTQIDELVSELDSLAAQIAGGVQGVLKEKGWTQVGGLRARRYVIDFSQGTVPATTEQVFVVRPGQTFQMICEADQSLFKEIHRGCQFIYDSFVFETEQ